MTRWEVDMRGMGRLGLVALLVLAGACGGDDDDDASPAADGDTVATGGDADAGDGGGDDGGDAADAGGESYGIFTVDGEELRYSMSNLEYSPNEAISDITLEDCDPSFFSAGLFVIGYPVDADGELLLADNGDIDGIVNVQLPNDINDTELMDVEMDLDHGPAGLDVRYRGDDTGQTVYEIDGNRATGTIVLKNSSQEPTVVDFEIVCAEE